MIQRIYLYLLHILSDGYYFNLPLCFLAIISLFLYHSNFFEFFSLSTQNKGKQQKLKLKVEEKNNIVYSTGNHNLGSKSLKKRSKNNNNNNVIVEDETITFHHNTDNNDGDNNLFPTFDEKIKTFPGDILCLLTSWFVYVFIWHGVLSNIPLSSPMPYGVHAR